MSKIQVIEAGEYGDAIIVQVFPRAGREKRHYFPIFPFPICLSISLSLYAALTGILSRAIIESDRTQREKEREREKESITFDGTTCSALSSFFLKRRPNSFHGSHPHRILYKTAKWSVGRG